MPIPNNIRVDPIKRNGDRMGNQFGDWADSLEYDGEDDGSSDEDLDDVDDELEGLDEDERKRVLRKREREKAKRRANEP